MVLAEQLEETQDMLHILGVLQNSGCARGQSYGHDISCSISIITRVSTFSF